MEYDHLCIFILLSFDNFLNKYLYMYAFINKLKKAL